MNMNINIHHIGIYFCHSVTICFCHRYTFFCVKSGWGMLVAGIYINIIIYIYIYMPQNENQNENVFSFCGVIRLRSSPMRKCCSGYT